EHEASVHLARGHSQSPSGTTINSDGFRSIHRRRAAASGSDRLPGSVLLARERLVERLRGVSVSGNRQSSRSPSDTHQDGFYSRVNNSFVGTNSNLLETRSERLIDTTIKNPPGLTRDALNSLQLEIFSNENDEKTSRECTICLESFQDGDKLIRLHCGHEFHSCCIFPWVREHEASVHLARGHSQQSSRSPSDTHQDGFYSRVNNRFVGTNSNLLETRSERLIDTTIKNPPGLTRDALNSLQLEIFSNENDEKTPSEIESAHSVTDDHLSILHMLFGKNLERATRIVDQRGVKKISGQPSQRSIFQVSGEQLAEMQSCLGLSTSDKQKEVINCISGEGLSMCAVFKTHIKPKRLNKVGDSIFGKWEWCSNMQFCDKDCRIMLGWDNDRISMNVVQRDKQAILSGSSSMTSDMYEFKDCVNSIEVEEMASSGMFFTWTKNLFKVKAGDSSGVLKKLDRIMGDEDFIDKFPQAHAVFLPYLISDHSSDVAVQFVKHFQDFLGKAADVNDCEAAVSIIKKKLSFKEASFMVTDIEDDEVLMKIPMIAGDGRISLRLRDEVRQVIVMKVGNGEKTSVIYDNWCGAGILQSFITNRDLYNVRWNANLVVKDIVEDNISVAWGMDSKVSCS
nr:probable E3 ubiquitin-protein ligase RHY1A [Tanacetum cinerariifolium]